MTMRITHISRSNGTILRVEGKLHSAYVDALAEECFSLESLLCLELDNLYGIDAAGADLLARLESQGVELRGASPYISLRIQCQQTLSTFSDTQSV